MEELFYNNLYTQNDKEHIHFFEYSSQEIEIIPNIKTIWGGVEYCPGLLFGIYLFYTGTFSLK